MFSFASLPGLNARMFGLHACRNRCGRRTGRRSGATTILNTSPQNGSFGSGLRFSSLSVSSG